MMLSTESLRALELAVAEDRQVANSRPEHQLAGEAEGVFGADGDRVSFHQILDFHRYPLLRWSRKSGATRSRATPT
jgi:hypothetical protein